MPPLTVCVPAQPAPNAPRTGSYPGYIHEILKHAGIGYETITETELISANHTDPARGVLVTVGETANQEFGAALTRWVAGGGAWLSIAGVCCAADCLGVSIVEPAFVGWSRGARSLGEGYLVPTTGHPVFDAMAPVHFFGGICAAPNGASILARAVDHHQRADTGIGLAENAFGQGHCMFLAPDAVGSIVHIQQGRAVTRDGVSAPDGTAPTTDGVLKTDDGLVLDWIFDRQPIEGVPGLSGFARAIADEWRDLLLRCVFHLASRIGASIPLLWYYPDNLPGLAHLSHDSDNNEPDKAVILRNVLEECGINSTWCIISPGYPPAEMRAIAEAGHELAFHYDAMSPGRPWCREQFMAQYAEVKALCGGYSPVSNKDHYLRWQGDTELLEWCRDAGIQWDESKGTSKTGEVGFPFGSCHPYFMLDFPGEPIDVLELATPTQDLLVFAPEPAVAPLMATATRHYGILHLLFHPAHIDKPGVADALKNSVAKAKSLGMQWWTATRINSWERARRTVTWSFGNKVEVQTKAPLAGATLMWLDPQNKNPAETTVTRWGFSFNYMTTDLEPGKPCQLQ